ncbi:biotin-dependent carboxyltransferase family protein [Sphingomonas sp. NCPPB 2930]
MIEILSSTALASVQDLGRLGCLGYGVGTSGAMDSLALAVGNLMLGNDENAAGVEIPVFPFKLRFQADTAFALTGGHGAPRLDGLPLPPWWAAQAQEGQVLEITQPTQGARTYLTVAGGIDVPEVLGSRSTQLRGAFGGLDGRSLRKGDLLPCGPSEAAARVGAGFGIAPPGPALAREAVAESESILTLRAIPAAEYGLYTEASQQAFWQSEWKLTAQSDRYGYRLAGEPLVASQVVEIRSHGIVPGVVQVPHSGQPIIQMRDAQPSGGYPKVATVIEADLWRLGQAPIGSRLRFASCSYDQARDALAANRRYIEDVRRTVGLQRLLGR